MEAARRSSAPDVADVEERVYLSGVSWKDFESLLAIRGESNGVRIAYLKGTVELMSPGNPHENDKTRFARLVEAWSEAVGIDLDGVGSWTLMKKAVERAVEPDECYIILARHRRPPKVPDFAIEVVKSSGGLDKLEIYRLLGVREVWFWKDRTVSFYLLRGQRYVRATRSALLPTFDGALIARFMSKGSQPEAVRALRRAVGRKRSARR